jgi:hypothetical protein
MEECYQSQLQSYKIASHTLSSVLTIARKVTRVATLTERIRVAEDTACVTKI